MHFFRAEIHASERLESRRLLSGTPSLLLHPPASQNARSGVGVELNLGKLIATKVAGPFAIDVNWGDGSADTTFTQTKAGRLSPQGHVFSVVGLQTVDVHATSESGLTAAETLHARVLPDTGSITGQVFNDTNSKRGQNGPPVAGATLFLDLNHDGQVDAGDPTAVTNATGVYRFNAVPPGSYVLEQSLTSAIDLSLPSAGYSRVVVGLRNVRAKPFGDGTIQKAEVILIPPLNQQLISGVNQLVKLGGLISISSTAADYGVEVDWGDRNSLQSESYLSSVSSGPIPPQSHVFLHAPGVDVVKLMVYDTASSDDKVLKQISFAVDLLAANAASSQAVLSSEVTLTTVVSFGGKALPTGVVSMQVDPDGNIFAATPTGGAPAQGVSIGVFTFASGTLFKIPAGAKHLGSASKFSWDDDSLDAIANALVIDHNDSVYLNVTYPGGTDTTSGVTAFDDNGFSQTFLQELDDTDLPIFDGSNNAYFDSDYQIPGGSIFGGEVDEIPANSTTITTITNFSPANNTQDEPTPVDLVHDAAGNIYGATVLYSVGDDTPYNEPLSLFKIAAQTHAVTTLYNFPASSGNVFFGDLTSDADGNLYGLYGTSVFELRAGTSQLTTLTTLDSADAANTSVLCDPSGNLFILSPTGGAAQDGKISEIAAVTGKVTTVATFDGANGTSPFGLIFDKAGNLYGLTSSGGTLGTGTAFTIGAGTSTVNTLIDFGASTGVSPSLGLYADGHGNLYGATAVGGPQGQGTIFKISGTGFDVG